MSASELEIFLAKHIGLDVQSVGSSLIQQVQSKRMIALDIRSARDYVRLVEQSEAEQKALIDGIVVLETWFFRNHAAFDFLAKHIRETWLKQTRRTFRILTIPCATGEEAYSIAITLMENGLAPERFNIDALDICERALNTAKQGLYGQSSFRGQVALKFRSRYFEPVTAQHGMEYYQIHPATQSRVRFVQGNLLEPEYVLLQPGYDVVFCRNLLIYFTTEARKQAVANLARFLADDGVLFLGHAERSMVCEQGFVQISQPGAFACRKPGSDDPQRKPLPERNRNLSAKSPLSTRPSTYSRPSRPTITPLPVYASSSQAAPASAHTVDAHYQSLLDDAQRLADQGLLTEALRACEKCLQHKPDDIPANFLLGVVYQALDKDVQAENYFNKTLYLEPAHLDALNHLVFLVEKRGQREQASRLRQRLQRLRERGNYD